jgi:hypothetical protein
VRAAPFRRLPNVAELEPGAKGEIWYFDGSPMGGVGEWKLAGSGTVSADGTTITTDPGQNLRGQARNKK